MTSISLSHTAQRPGPQPWFTQGSVDPSPNAALTLANKPGDYSLLLFDCTFAAPEYTNDSYRVLDNEGKTLGAGRTLNQACWFAKKTREAQNMLPYSFDPLLEGCTFGAMTEGGQPLRTVLQPDRNTITGSRILASAEDRSKAAREAALVILRERPLQSLSVDQFSRICTVVTVEIMRGKSGRATTGETWLRADSVGASNNGSGIHDLRSDLAYEAVKQGVGAFDRTDWVNTRLNEIMHSPLIQGGWEHVQLAHNQHVVLRTRESAAAMRCIRELYGHLLCDVDRPALPVNESMATGAVAANARYADQQRQRA